MNENGLCDIRQLSEILKREDEESDSEDDLPNNYLSKLGPGHIGKSKQSKSGEDRNFKVKTSAGVDCVDEDVAAINTDAIWRDDEVVNAPTGEERFDPREQPEYDIKYSQSVSPEDVFLQIGGKTGATASCENMVVTLVLEGESKTAVDLTVTRTTLEIRSPLYRLNLHLPHPVDPDSGRAEWDNTKNTLAVTLRMVREYDFINF